jgi:hypothetical protein
MMPNHFISALEPIFVFGLVALFALSGFED